MVRRRTSAVLPVHPHACGEHFLLSLFKEALLGSSPRLWGTFCSEQILPRRPRFIPTPVGNIKSKFIGTLIITVHPHACGEHLIFFTSFSIPTGSSPRLWGTSGPRNDPPHPIRFIPTPVGNMRPTVAKYRFRPVHPHACGEHVDNFDATSDPFGSSPRLWGTLRMFPAHVPRLRFIPTPVGNISSRAVRCPLAQVHPHACGEHIFMASEQYHGVGSSPRLWGTWRNANPNGLSGRFIPTPVGNINRW